MHLILEIWRHFGASMLNFRGYIITAWPLTWENHGRSQPCSCTLMLQGRPQLLTVAPSFGEALGSAWLMTLCFQSPGIQSPYTLNNQETFFHCSIWHIPIIHKNWSTSWWLNQPPLKNMNQIGSFLQIGVKIQRNWNHHLVEFHKTQQLVLWDFWTINKYISSPTGCYNNPKGFCQITASPYIHSIKLALWMISHIVGAHLAGDSSCDLLIPHIVGGHLSNLLVRVTLSPSQKGRRIASFRLSTFLSLPKL